MRSLSLFPSLALLFLAGCPPAPEDEDSGEEARVEGAEGGDCSDGADNDQDGAFDCDDDGCAASPDCGTENAAPSGAAIAIEPAAPTDEDDLACVIVTASTDPNGDAVSYRYAWSIDGAAAGIDGETVSAALTSGGETWTCTVTPTDGTLDGVPATASATIAVGNQAPSAPTVSITPAEPTDDDVLTCVIETESVDPDGDAVTYSYAWSVDGVDAGLTSASVNGSLTTEGQTWTCSVTASDGELSAASASASVRIESCALGSDAGCPGASCLDVLEAGASTGDGIYWVDPDGAGAFMAYCDMRDDDGGWTLVAVGVNGSTSFSEWITEDSVNESLFDEESPSRAWHMSSDLVNALLSERELRVGCDDVGYSSYYWEGVGTYTWTASTSASAANADYDFTGTSYETTWQTTCHWGVVAVPDTVTSHCNNGDSRLVNPWYCAAGTDTDLFVWAR